MFTYEHAWTTLIYYTAFNMLFLVVFGSIHGAIMGHRHQNAKNEQRLIDAELDEIKYKEEGYWKAKSNEYCSYGIRYCI